MNRIWTIVLVLPFLVVIVGLIALSHRQSGGVDLMSVVKPGDTDTSASPDGKWAVQVVQASSSGRFPRQRIEIYPKIGRRPLHSWVISGYMNGWYWLPDSRRLLVIYYFMGRMGYVYRNEIIDVVDLKVSDPELTFYDQTPDLSFDSENSLISARFSGFDPTSDSGRIGVEFDHQVIGRPDLTTHFWVKPPKNTGHSAFVSVSNDCKRLLWHYNTVQTSPVPLIGGAIPAHGEDDFWISNIDGSHMRKLWTAHHHVVSFAAFEPADDTVQLTIDGQYYTAKAN